MTESTQSAGAVEGATATLPESVTGGGAAAGAGLEPAHAAATLTSAMSAIGAAQLETLFNSRIRLMEAM